MGKKLIKSTAIGVATLISFVIANGVHAEEDVNKIPLQALLRALRCL